MLCIFLNLLAVSAKLQFSPPTLYPSTFPLLPVPSETTFSRINFIVSDVFRYNVVLIFVLKLFYNFSIAVYGFNTKMRCDNFSTINHCTCCNKILHRCNLKRLSKRHCCQFNVTNIFQLMNNC